LFGLLHIDFECGCVFDVRSGYFCVRILDHLHPHNVRLRLVGSRAMIAGPSEPLRPAAVTATTTTSAAVAVALPAPDSHHQHHNQLHDKSHVIVVAPSHAQNQPPPPASQDTIPMAIPVAGSSYAYPAAAAVPLGPPPPYEPPQRST
jgi:hypothetical protein